MDRAMYIEMRGATQGGFYNVETDMDAHATA